MLFQKKIVDLYGDSLTVKVVKAGRIKVVASELELESVLLVLDLDGSKRLRKALKKAERAMDPREAQRTLNTYHAAKLIARAAR